MSNIIVTTPGSTPVRELRPSEANQRTPQSGSKLNLGGGASASKLFGNGQQNNQQDKSKRLSASPPPFIPASMMQQSSVSPMRPMNFGNANNGQIQQQQQQQPQAHQHDVNDCMCPTCQYYRAAMILHHHPAYNMMMMPNMMMMIPGGMNNSNNNANNHMPPMNPLMMQQMMQMMQAMMMQQQQQQFGGGTMPFYGGNNNHHHHVPAGSNSNNTPARGSQHRSGSSPYNNNHQNNNNHTNHNNRSPSAAMMHGSASPSPGIPLPHTMQNENASMSQQQMELPSTFAPGLHHPYQAFNFNNVNNYHHATASNTSSSSSPSPHHGMPAADALNQFRAAVGHIATVCCTNGGRQMLQAALRAQRPEVVAQALSEMLAELETVSVDVNGCHVLRSLVEVLNEQQADELAKAMSEKIVLAMCTTSQHTRRSLQTLFERHHAHSASRLQSVVDIVASNALYLSQTQQGCIALMRVFENCNDAQKHCIVEPLLSGADGQKHFARLAVDPFGNYVVQCVLVNSNPVTRAQYVLQGLRGCFVELACNKYSSNVLEKVVRHATAIVRSAFVDELIRDEAKLEHVAADQYGNFVLQTLVETAVAPDEYELVAERVKAVLPKTQYARKLEAKLKHAQKIVLASTSGARSASLSQAALATSPSPTHRGPSSVSSAADHDME